MQRQRQQSRALGETDAQQARAVELRVPGNDELGQVLQLFADLGRRCFLMKRCAQLGFIALQAFRRIAHHQPVAFANPYRRQPGDGKVLAPLDSINSHVVVGQRQAFRER